MGYVAKEWMTTINTAQSCNQPIFIGQAQTFTASSSYNLRAISLNLGASAVPLVADVYITSTNPDGSPDETDALATMTVEILVEYPLTVTYFIDLPAPLALTKGVLYAIVVVARTTDDVILSANNNSVYTEGGNWGWNINIGWNFNNGRDLFFETLVVVNPPAVSTHPVSGLPTGDNGIITIKRAVMAANNKIWYES